MIDHYDPQIMGAQDYYPFGMLSRVAVPNDDPYYRFGFNGQMQDNDVKGLGNSYTALYWEYDSRIGRRWNLDPKPTVGISEYSAFNNSPIKFDDPDGDCATCPRDAKFGATHSEKDAGGATPLGGFVFAGKDATLKYTNIGDEKNPNWVISSFQKKAGDVYAWNNEKKWYVNNKGSEYDQAWYHDITDWGNKQFGKPLSEAAKNAIEGEPLKDTRTAYSQYKAEGGSFGVLGFVGNGVVNSLSGWGSDLAAGGHRSGQAIIGGWQFSADISLGAGLRSTNSLDLLSFRNGYGPFGEQGLKIGNFRIDMLYRNPASGLEHGTLFSLKQLKKGGSILRWDYGALHSGGEGWHSTFRFTIQGAQYGSSAQRSWTAPFMFFKYKKL